MKIFNAPIRGLFAMREERITQLLENQLKTQKEWFGKLIDNGYKSKFGKDFKIRPNWDYSQFSRSIPTQTYSTLFPYIQKIIEGEEYVLSHNKVNWVAQSSGTTSAKSKYIPVTAESLKSNNYLAARDSLTFYCHLFPNTNIFGGKGVMLGGSIHDICSNAKVKCGDVSAILMQNMPIIGDFLKAPNREILLGKEWDKKLKLIAKNTVNENITSISGVPSWMLLVLKEVLKISKKKTIAEIWPELEVYFHGGVSFAPYRQEFEQILGEKSIFYMNMYNASEGFFGFQDQKEEDDLLLLADHGVFYEFAPIDEVGNRSEKIIPLSEVTINQNYALLITTLSGLWRYEIGDTLRFTSLNPYRFQITGRTTHFINTFGEELIVENADKAVKNACIATQSIFSEYTAAPIFLHRDSSYAGHQWIIEFNHPPQDLVLFTIVLDNTLKELNSDYEAKRNQDLLLQMPQIKIAPIGTFMKWLEKKQKLGGQFKVPRLQNDRIIIEEIIEIIEENEK